MVLLVKGYKGQLDAQQLGVGLWQPPTTCHKEQELLLVLNIPAIHNLYSMSVLHTVKLQHRRLSLEGGYSIVLSKEFAWMFIAPDEQALGM